MSISNIPNHQYGLVATANRVPTENAYLVNQTKPVFTSLYEEGSEPFGLALYVFGAREISSVSMTDQFHSFRNISNQPAFGAGLLPSVCAQAISFFNTSLTTGQYEPVAIRGSITFNPPLLPAPTAVSVFGYKLDVAFLERQFTNCADLKGYAGTGSGDSG